MKGSVPVLKKGMNKKLARGITTLMMYTNEGEMISKRFIN
jgi:hypothetical protein